MGQAKNVMLLPTLVRWRMHNKNKLAPYGTDDRFFTTEVSAKFKVM